MKILAIRFKNLASLEGETEIDFTQEPLSSAGIFAITGPTGAGKSTILDALCLALYSKTPRYMQAKETGIEIYDVPGNKISQSDTRGILRDGTADGFAEVDFAATDGQSYKARWSVRRARNRAEGNLLDYVIALKNLHTNSDIPGKNTELRKEIERLVGLNFEQFTRSVLLAQGDFTAFLKAGKDEKSALLEKLTGTHIYSEISRRIFEKHRIETQELRDLSMQRAGITTLTSEETDTLSKLKNELEIASIVQEKQVTEFTKEISWHEQLSNLQNNLTAANVIYEQVAETKTNSAEREQKLKQTELVQPARTFVDGLHYVEQQLTDKLPAKQELESTLEGYIKQKIDLVELLNSAGADVISKNKALEEAKPLLEEAKKIDIQIGERKEQVAQSEKEADSANENFLQQQKQLINRQEENDQLIIQIGKLQKWKTENIARQPIVDNHGLIASKLVDAKKLLDTLQTVSLQVKTLQETFDFKTQEKEKLDKQLSGLQTALESALQTYEAKFVEVSVVSLTDLNNNKLSADEAVEEMIKADAHWKLLFSSLKEHETVIRSLAENKNDFDSKKEQLTETFQQLETTKVQRETSLKMMEKARLASTENVETLRSNLGAEDPCPVCGSIEHPYVSNNPQFDHLLAELETTHQEHEIAYINCFSTHNTLNSNCDQLQKIIVKQEIELKLKEEALQGLKKTWTTFSIHQESTKLMDEEKAGWLLQRLNEKRVLQKSLQEQIQSYHEQKQQLEDQKKLLDKSTKQIAEITNTRKDTDRTLQSLLEQLKQNADEQDKVNSDLNKIRETMLPIFSSDGWFDQWKKNSETFVQRINDFVKEWKSNTVELDEISKQHEILTAAIRGMEEQLQRALSESEKKKVNFLALDKQFRDLIQKRKTFFNGEAAANIEMSFKQSIETAQQTLDHRKIENDKLLNSITRITTQKEQAEKDISQLEKQKSTYHEKIQHWLLTYNIQNDYTLDELELIKLLALSAEWMEAEKFALRYIYDAVTKAKSVLDERQTLLQQHKQQRLSEKEKEELIELMNQAKAVLQQTTKDKTEIEFQLKQDETNKEKIGTLLKTIETKSLVVENWAKLNDIIGSADGKKFRQVAQEYTLDVLLSYANVHLEMLSKRYLLQRIPGTLGLQILDLDMGNEVRTVYSLSGGESFLVSLALALGLASLSSSRMQVESLFIDEGFGSLDPNTLNIAMDALERLHNQGRKVGVISHVQEMTERIPVQIKVSKQNSGKSKVEVIEI